MTHFSKNIILCFDGTLENFGAQPFTNVLKIFQMLDKSDNNKQLCYYQPGIGTSADFDQSYDFKRFLSVSSVKNSFDAMFAFSLDVNIKKAYTYLMRFWNHGDKIYMFGFSRGAFIARVLAGMLERVGLLNKGSEHLVDMAWKIYVYWEYAEQPTTTNYTSTIVEEFRKSFCYPHTIEIHFQGLFDSVNSVGILRDRSFPYTQKSNIVNHIRHALAIDERRGKFKQQNFAYDSNSPSLLTPKYKRYTYVHSYSPPESSNNETIIEGETGFDFQWSSPPRTINIIKSPTLPSHEYTYSPNISPQSSGPTLNNFKAYTPSYSQCSKPIQSNVNVEGKFVFEPVPMKKLNKTACSDLVEKWFSGDHSDIGGSWATNCRTQEVVSNTPLRWILSESVKFGVKFSPNELHLFDAQTSLVNSILTPINDCLDLYQNKKLAKIFHDTQMCSKLCTDSPMSSNKFINQIQRDIKKQLNSSKTKEELLKHMYNISCGNISRIMILVWWCLECVPIGYKIENEDGKLKTIYAPNLGRSRNLPENADLHWSVYWRIKYDDNYRPQNLPRYVRKILKEFEGINFKEKACSYLPIFTFKEDPEFLQLDGYFGDKLDDIHKLHSKIFNKTLMMIQYRKTRKLYRKWSESCWENFPDDLRSCLVSNENI